MKSLRFKLTLALMTMSFVAIAIVGLTSRWLILSRFDELITDYAFRGFEGQIVAYYNSYGSWEAARKGEPFLEFAKRFGAVAPPPRGALKPRSGAGSQGSGLEQPMADGRTEPGGVGSQGSGLEQPMADGRTEPGGVRSQGSGLEQTMADGTTESGGVGPQGSGLEQPMPGGMMGARGPRPRGPGMERPMPGGMMGARGPRPRGPGMERPMPGGMMGARGPRPRGPEMGQPMPGGMREGRGPRLRGPGMGQPPPDGMTQSRGVGPQGPAMEQTMTGGTMESGGISPQLSGVVQPTIGGTKEAPGVGSQGSGMEQTLTDSATEARAPEPHVPGTEQPMTGGTTEARGPRPAGTRGGVLPPTPRRLFVGSPTPFLLVDRTGKVVLSTGGRKAGSLASEKEMARARPIVDRGKEIGLAIPLQRPQLSELESQYLAEVKDAWVYSLFIAAALAIPIGILLGSRFTAPIRELTGAIRGMQGGELRQQVRVRTNDEIGELSHAFNRMSANQARAYRDLETSRAQLAEQAALLKELSLRDDLTGLFNRRGFDEQIATLFARASRFHHPLTLAMADIDFFKSVNDHFSHTVGDAVLREVARLITATVREIDLVARYGGEEFAIAFPETDLAGASRTVERLREAVEGHDWGQLAPGLAVTLSVGLSQRGAEESFQLVLDAADIMLYEAKEGGRNLVRF